MHDYALDHYYTIESTGYLKKTKQKTIVLPPFQNNQIRISRNEIQNFY